VIAASGRISEITELPIRADYVGKNIPTAKSESVKVHLAEYDKEDLVELIK